MVVGAAAASGLLAVEAPETARGVQVYALADVRRQGPVCGARLQRQRPWAHACRPIIEADRGQALEVTVAARVVDVEPGRPLAGLCGHHTRWDPGRRRSGPINSCENPGLPTPISHLNPGCPALRSAWASPAFPDPEPSSTGAAKRPREVVFLLQPPLFCCSAQYLSWPRVQASSGHCGTNP